MKKSLLVSFTAISMLGWATNALAAENAAINSVNNQVGIAFAETLMNYQEHINPGPSDTESGWMPGLHFHVRGTSQRLYGSVNFSYNTGDINYYGALQDGTPYNGTDSATTMRLLGKAGYMFPIASNIVLTPYIAGGWQHWNRHLLGSSGYTENYSASLVGLGAKLQYAYDPRLVLSLNVNALAILMGGMSPSGLATVEGNNAQFKPSGEEDISIGADYAVFNDIHLFGNIDFTHFNYTGGSLQASYPEYAFEPSSSTNMFGLNLGVAYSF